MPLCLPGFGLGSYSVSKPKLVGFCLMFENHAP